jgi:NADPH:quinone reductase-like Zn-dependent oxidoreductase
MKAVVLHEYGGPEKLSFEDDAPQPQVSGDTVLIATTAASVNPIDWKIRSGSRQKVFPLSFPAILGRDVSGGSWCKRKVLQAGGSCSRAIERDLR